VSASEERSKGARAESFGVNFQAPRGTYDLLPERARVRRRIVVEGARLLEGAGFGQIETPIFEDTELFARTVGDATDIVAKEMYTFVDRSERSLTLRPEGSAPVARAYIEHGMHKLPQPVKLWYAGPMFRYEAPQSGRFRQHTQIGAESIGSDDPAADAELIDVLGQLLARLGVGSVRLHLNSIGDAVTRAEYQRELRDFLLASDVFSAEQRTRIERNPMRAFDWSEEEIVALTDDAPKMLDRLTDEDRQHFQELRALLDGAGIDYMLDPRLVRGLDYYTRTVFEFRSDALRAQSGLGGGGRYDRLVEQIGGGPTPAVGWGAGVERIELAIDAGQAAANEAAAARPTIEPPSAGGTRGPSVVVAVLEAAARQRAFRLLSELREQDVAATMDLGGRSLKGALRYADRLGARFAVIVGPREWEAQKATLRDMVRSEQEEVELAHLRDELLALLSREVARR
jgi:histidyl-tRNA synthetase